MKDGSEKMWKGNKGEKLWFLENTLYMFLYLYSKMLFEKLDIFVFQT